MSQTLTDAERQRLIGILGMLGSTYAGERANAARLATEFCKHHNATWADLMTGANTVYVDRQVVVEKTVYVDRIVYVDRMPREQLARLWQGRRNVLSYIAFGAPLIIIYTIVAYPTVAGVLAALLFFGTITFGTIFCIKERRRHP